MYGLGACFHVPISASFSCEVSYILRIISQRKASTNLLLLQLITQWNNYGIENKVDVLLDTRGT